MELLEIKLKIMRYRLEVFQFNNLIMYKIKRIKSNEIVNQINFFEICNNVLRSIQIPLNFNKITK
jgi:hypothetical protein